MRNVLIALAFVAFSAPALANEEDAEKFIFRPILPGSMNRQLPALDLKIKTGEKIPDFKARDLADNNLDIPIIRKDKILIVRFIQSDIAMALQQFEHLNNVATVYEGKVIVLDIVTKDITPNDKLIDQYEKARTIFYVVKDPDGNIADAFGVQFTPVLMIFDKEGKLYKYGTVVMPNHLSEVVDEMLGTKLAPKPDAQ